MIKEWRATAEGEKSDSDDEVYVVASDEGHSGNDTEVTLVQVQEPEVMKDVPTPEKGGDIDYSEKEFWVSRPKDIEYDVDVFFVCPTAVQGDEGQYMIDLENDEQRSRFKENVRYQRGIYNDNANFFAPYYHEMTLNGYYADVKEADREEYLQHAYQDVKDAFSYYLNKHNEGRPIVIAGFSQGGDMVKRLLKDYQDNEDLYGRLVAAYIIGWNVTDKDIEENNKLVLAQNETDTGVVVSYCSEAVEYNNFNVIVPEKTHSINPLNWKTDGTEAKPEENLGFCMLNSDGEISQEWLNPCGAYIDKERGTIKVTGIPISNLPPDLGFLESGNFHVYDYMMFYRNLEKNVQYRIYSYLHNGEKLDEFEDDFYKRTEGPEPQVFIPETVSSNSSQ